MNIAGCVPRFLKVHGGLILTILEGLGFVGTVILVANETPKAEEAIVEAIVEKSKDSPEVQDLTTWEKIKAAAPEYIPAMIVGSCTMACLIGRQVLHTKQNAVILSAYAALAAEFERYRGEIRNEYGEDADKKALMASKAEIRRLRQEVKELEKVNAPLLYGIETLPGVVFEAKAIDIQEAFMHFNRDLVLGGENTLDELYRFIGIPEQVYDKKSAEDFGWNEYENEVDWGINYVDFGLEGIMAKNGQIVHMITMSVPPYNLNGEYGAPGETTLEERIFEGYQPRRARQLAASIMEKNELTKINHQPIYSYNAYLPN